MWMSSPSCRNSPPLVKNLPQRSSHLRKSARTCRFGQTGAPSTVPTCIRSPRSSTFALCSLIRPWYGPWWIQGPSGNHLCTCILRTKGINPVERGPLIALLASHYSPQPQTVVQPPFLLSMYGLSGSIPWIRGRQASSCTRT